MAAGPDALLTQGEELLARPLACANHAKTLLAAISPAEPDQARAAAAVRALELFFADSLQRGELRETGDAPTEGLDAATAAHRQWLARQHAAYTGRLLGLLAQPAPPALQIAAFASVLELARAGGAFQPRLFTAALQIALASRHADPGLMAALAASYLDFIDVRYHAFRAVSALAQWALAPSKGNPLGLPERLLQHLPAEAQVSRAGLISSLHSLLSQLRPLDSAAAPKPAAAAAEAEAEAEAAAAEQRSWCGALEAGAVRQCRRGEGSQGRRKRKREAAEAQAEAAAGDSRPAAKWLTPSLQRKAFSEAWLAFLRLPLPPHTYKKVLVRLHEAVMPHMTNPLLLADLLTHALDQGGLVGLLALHAIFVLISKHALEYPGFYARLYGLLTPETLLASHRARFFRLADLFLGSPLIPAYTVAAFAKRFARLALAASPAGALVCLAFVHNLLRRHPACLSLLDRPPNPKAPVTASVTAGADPFDAGQADPAQARALQSSLWELRTLRRHAHWQVAGLADQILQKDLADRRKTAELDIAPFVGAGYASLAQAELARKLRRPPQELVPSAAAAPERLFGREAAAAFAGWAF